MPKTFRSRGFALLTLVAFLVAQPIVGCTAVCLFGAHHAAHTMAAMAHGGSSVGTDACHASHVGTVQPDPIQPLSPMEPAPAAAIAFAPARSYAPAPASQAFPYLAARAVESPPPRV
jgi:hypothetical protein